MYSWSIFWLNQANCLKMAVKELTVGHYKIILSYVEVRVYGKNIEFYC